MWIDVRPNGVVPMNALLLLAASMAMPVAADNSSPDRPAPERAKIVLPDSVRIQGNWEFVGFERERPAARAAFFEGVWKVTLTIQDGRYFNPAYQSLVSGGKYDLDEEAKPHRATLTWIEEADPLFKTPRVQRTKVILYDLDGDTLRLCVGREDSCPTRFTSNDNQSVFVFKREKSAEK